MKQTLLVIITLITISSCTNTQQQNPHATQDSANVNMDSMLANSRGEQKEITDDDRYAWVNDTFVTVPPGRKLRYLFYANGGLWGYYNDGTVSDCPRCDFCTEAIERLNKRNPYASYVTDGDSLTVTYHDSTKEKVELYEDKDMSQGWALIDYKWLKKASSAYK